MTEKFVKKLFGEKDTEAVLERLNRLTQEEAKLTAAQTLQVVHGLVQDMRVATDGEQIYQACQMLGVEYRLFLDCKSSLDFVRNALGNVFEVQTNHSGV